jgi:hypothetical protein
VTDGPSTTPGPGAGTRPGSTADLGLVGNGTVSALVDERGRFVWGCLPHLAADPTFCALLGPTEHDGGYLEVELEGFAHSE